MMLPSLYIAPVPGKDRGVFCSEKLEAHTTIEVSPVLVMPESDRQHLDQTLLHDYIFLWGEEQNEVIVALGYLSMYNHAYESNCDYEMDYENRTMRIYTVTEIAADTELTINYNGSWNDPTPLWFEAI